MLTMYASTGMWYTSEFTTWYEHPKGVFDDVLTNPPFGKIEPCRTDNSPLLQCDIIDI